MTAPRRATAEPVPTTSPVAPERAGHIGLVVPSTGRRPPPAEQDDRNDEDRSEHRNSSTDFELRS
jgi:hypothetical protein